MYSFNLVFFFLQTIIHTMIQLPVACKVTNPVTENLEKRVSYRTIMDQIFEGLTNFFSVITSHCPARLADKPWLKVLLVDLL